MINNGKSHFVVSIVKSLTRIVSSAGCFYGAMISNLDVAVLVLALGIGLAEILGIVEEAVDKRK